MKLLTAICRILVGGLFIFSGFIKSNDPKGFGIKLEEYFEVFAGDFSAKQDSIVLLMKDNQGNTKTDTIAIQLSDTGKTITFNSSAPRKVAFGNSDDSTVQDSVYKADAFVLVDGEVKYQTDYTFTDSSDKVIYTIAARIKDDSSFRHTHSFGFNKVEATHNLSLVKHVKENNWLVGFFKGLKPYAVLISIIICVLEIMLGFAILIGWKPIPVSWLLLLMILFFTFLTWYSYTYNKVTDCGCFGDFIKLKPVESFWKDIILLALILVIFLRRKHIKPLFSPGFGSKSVVLVTMMSIAFAVYCDRYLPVIDFLPYEKGNDLVALMTPPKGARVRDSFENRIVYQKDGVYDTFDIHHLPQTPPWKWVNTISVVVAPKNWTSKIHDFNFIKRPDSDVAPGDSILYQKGYKLLVISKALDESNEGSWDNIREMTSKLVAQEHIPVYGLTATITEEADKFGAANQLPFKFWGADQTLLKTMIRSNPGIILMKDATIIRKWSCHNIPSYERVKKRMQ